MKLFKTLFLLLIIFITGSFIFGTVVFKMLDPSNSMNRAFRKPVIAIPLLRKLLRLNQLGDARYEYVTKRFNPMKIYVYYQEGVALDSKSVDSFVREMYHITHKATQITVETPQILTGIPEKVMDTDVDQLVARYGSDSSLFSNTVPLHIFVLKYYVTSPSYVGLVVDAHSIVLFKNAINYISEGEPSVVPTESSTLLHEFAHLTGAEHIQTPNCILTGTLETTVGEGSPTVIRDTYCDEDIQEINDALKL